MRRCLSEAASETSTIVVKFPYLAKTPVDVIEGEVCAPPATSGSFCEHFSVHFHSELDAIAGPAHQAIAIPGAFPNRRVGVSIRKRKSTRPPAFGPQEIKKQLLGPEAGVTPGVRLVGSVEGVP